MKERIGRILIALGMAVVCASPSVPQHGMPPILKEVPKNRVLIPVQLPP